MLLPLLIASTCVSCRGYSLAGPVLKRIKIVNRDAAAIQRELLEMPIPGISFSSYDPTDNSCVVETDTESSMEAVVQALSVVDQNLELAGVLSAKCPVVGSAFLVFTGPGNLDAGSDSIRIESQGRLDLHVASNGPLVVVFTGDCADPTKIGLHVDGASNQAMEPKSDAQGRTEVREVLPKSSGLAEHSIEFRVAEGRFTVKRIQILRVKKSRE